MSEGSRLGRCAHTRRRVNCVTRLYSHTHLSVVGARVFRARSGFPTGTGGRARVFTDELYIQRRNDLLQGVLVWLTAGKSAGNAAG